MLGVIHKMKAEEFTRFLDKAIPYCACGCGQRVNTCGATFLPGHWTRTEEARGILSRGEVRERAAESLGRRWVEDRDYMEAVVLKKRPLTYVLSEEEKKLSLVEVLERAYPYCSCGCGRRVKTAGAKYLKEHIGANLVGRMQSEETCLAKSIAVTPTMIRYWKEVDIETKNRRLRRSRLGASEKPNVPESMLLSKLNELVPGIFSYNGTGEVVVGGKIPDFISVSGSKLIIELFGEYWHNAFLFPNRMTEEETIENYRKYGYDCLVVWDYEVYIEGEKLDKRLVDFVEGGEVEVGA